jgi:DNA invertase Pin-like site-specific DNA recombinase
MRRHGGGAATEFRTPEAVIYTRVSREDQELEGVSLPAQLSECRQYAALRGFVIDAEYTDTQSGLREDRRDYQAMLARVRTLVADGRRVVVVVSSLDRFGRQLERVRSRDELDSLGVVVHSVREGGEVNDMLAGFLAVIAEQESKRTRIRIKRVWAHLHEQGWFKVGPRIPWGYQRREATEDERRAGAPKTVIDRPDDSAVCARGVRARCSRRVDPLSVGGRLSYRRMCAAYVIRTPAALGGVIAASFVPSRAMLTCG